jgi:carbamoyl-phosphate synthase large subunit
METCSNDYIFLENFDGAITCPESLCVTFCDRHAGIGADGLVLMERSDCAAAKMRMFNADGSEGAMAGNALRCMAKYLHDHGLAAGKEIPIETAGGVKMVHIYTTDGLVTSASVDMGRASLDMAARYCTLPGGRFINAPAVIGGQERRITCVDMGNPHCVVFCDRVDAVDIEHVGPLFENAPCFPERINTEFIRVVNPRTIKMRVWERGSGETLACGTGACAAVVAAAANGLCDMDCEVSVRCAVGELPVCYTQDAVTLPGATRRVYSGEVEY